MEAVSTSPAPLAEIMSRMEAGEVDGALSLLAPIVRERPSDGQAHTLIGICQAQQGNLSAAIKSLETALLLSPDPVIEAKLAVALYHAGRIDQARWRVTRVLEADPENEEARQLWAHLQAPPAPQPVAPAPPPPPRAPTMPHASAAAPSYPPGMAAGPPPLQGAQGAPAYGSAPGVGLRLLRGFGWGLLYCQVWTVFSLLGALVISLFTSRIELAIIAFLILAALSTMFHSAMGVLTGVVVALMNADEDMGAWIGASVGLLILLIGIQFGFLAFWSVVFYLLVGRWIGKSVAARVQKPTAG